MPRTVVLALILDAGDEAGEQYMKRRAGEVDLSTVRRRFGTCRPSLERLLGARPGELALIDESMHHLWFDQPISGNPRKEN